MIKIRIKICGIGLDQYLKGNVQSRFSLLARKEAKNQ